MPNKPTKNYGFPKPDFGDAGEAWSQDFASRMDAADSAIKADRGVGTSGFSGGSGYSGDRGYSGFSGKSGFSAYSGYSGYRGLGLILRVTKLDSTSVPTPNVDTTDMLIITALAVTATFQNPIGTPAEGQKLLLRIKDNGGAQTLAWDTQYRAGTDLALPLSTVMTKTMYLSFIYNLEDTTWDYVGKIGGI